MTGLEAILGFFIGLAGNGIAAKAQDWDRERIEELLSDLAIRKQLIESRRSLSDEVKVACLALARRLNDDAASRPEKALVSLLGDEMFQFDIVEWLKAGGIDEGAEVKARLVDTLTVALQRAAGSAEQIAFLRNGLFEALDRLVFSNPTLAHWRHQLSLDYLRERVERLRILAEEAAGYYTAERQSEVLDRYCEKALHAWDIIDLSNLPAEDVQISTQALLLRQLYMPLRLNVESSAATHDDSGGGVEHLEVARERRRLRESGRRQSMAAPVRTEAIAIGAGLARETRLVVLGDPGGGKTTLLRWLATAYLLRYRKDPAHALLPDVTELPQRQWIPVLIRCRDLGEADLCRSFPDFLAQHLQKSELLPEEAAVMRAVILDRIARGEALLLVDGLDEITNPSVRVMFCQELERTAARYPTAHIVATSRIVGYRDMPYRMGGGFAHGVIAELASSDKDMFAQRWIEVTEPH